MNQEIMNVFNMQSNVPVFDQIRVSIASPEKIRSWSYGEMKKPETINYRTFKPERGGLFCARIYGPIKDYECLCGKYKRMKYKGVICEKCGVEVTLSKVRRERMGHIDLAVPVCHIWFLKSLPSRIGLLLDMPLKNLERVLYFEYFIIIDPMLTGLKRGQLLTESEYYEAQDEYGEDAFVAGIGAEGIRTMLQELNLEELSVFLRQEIAEATTELKPKKLAKRLKVVEAFLRSGNRPEWMILTVLPVISPELRPLVPLDGGRFAASDLNDLYRRVINRNNRLKRLMELRAPEIIIRNEKRLLQEAVDALFDNGRRGRVLTGSNKRPLKSLSDMLKGKQGRFRQNLLGKRVDYSGRSVIVVGPNLKLHQCGLPKKMALELFKPFIYSRLEAKGLSATVKQSKKMVEKTRPEVWDILEEVIREHPVLLNRAPTLHRMSIQAFEPILIEGKAIQLHPLVCAAFNADFDGDQMALHIPLSLEAQMEARVLMMSTNNILHPASGMPIIVPSQDIILGLYYATLQREGALGQGMRFFGLGELEHALENKLVTLHTKIHMQMDVFDEEGNLVRKVLETTPGRVLLAQTLPQHPDVPFSTVNKLMTKKEVSRAIDTIYRHCGQKETVLFADYIMRFGFREACKAGISFGKDDMVIPEEKTRLVAETQMIVKEYEKQYIDGLITRGEKYNKVVDAWAKCTDRVAEAMMDKISSLNPEADQEDRNGFINSIYMMSHSGARGSPAQMKQLAGMRGLMAKPSGEIIEIPIVSNFKEGLSVWEYFNSTHGARKGLADTALKTANSGYLTRRLVDVAQDAIIVVEDCETEKGLTVEAVIDSGQVIVSLSERVLGRVPLEDIVDPVTEKLIVKKGEMITEEYCDKIDVGHLTRIKIRSPLTCVVSRGICVKCYGRDLARGTAVNMGEAVGVIAAQSIGEPGTQLTMRTFHFGGAAQVVDQSFVESNAEGIISLSEKDVVEDSTGQLIVMGRRVFIKILDESGLERAVHKMAYGTRLRVKNGDTIKRGDRIGEWEPYVAPVLTAVEGYVDFESIVESMNLVEVFDETTGISQRVITEPSVNSKSSGLKPMVVIKDKPNGKIKILSNGSEARYLLAIGSILSVEIGTKVNAGDSLARIPTEGATSSDITGGLPRVAELFEARRPKDHAIIASMSGKIEFGREYKSKYQVIIHPEDASCESVEYMIPKAKHISIQDGDMVEKGEYLVEGHPAPHDILAVFGIEILAAYLIDEVQSVYRLQGVTISDKHIEVIVRQMLQKMEITKQGDSDFLLGEQIDKFEFDAINEKLIADNKIPVEGKVLLLGITKASLQTQSFISAASFQETTRVLTEAAINGKEDKLVGLKENVIVGRLIPVGTGRIMRRLKSEANLRDNAILETQKKADKNVSP